MPPRQTSAGQSALFPVQLSPGSHGSPLPVRQIVVEALKPSTGQSLWTPSQNSSTSQAPFAARQRAVLLASAGHAALVPGQLSSGSQTPPEARQVVVLALKPSAGQVALVPGQLSAPPHQEPVSSGR